MMNKYFVYILLSFKNHKSYVGFTSREPSDRLREHNIGKSKWTSENGPFELVYYEKFSCKECAIEREKFLKTGVGSKIVQVLIKGLESSVVSPKGG